MYPLGTKRYKGSKKRYITGHKPRKYVVYLCTLFVPVKVQRNTNKPQAARLSAFIRVPFVCTSCVYLCVYPLCVPLCTGAGTQQFILLMQHIPCTLVTGALGNEYIYSSERQCFWRIKTISSYPEQNRQRTAGPNWEKKINCVPSRSEPNTVKNTK